MITNRELRENLDRIEAQVKRNKPEDEIIETVTLPWDYIIHHRRKNKK